MNKKHIILESVTKFFQEQEGEKSEVHPDDLPMNKHGTIGKTSRESIHRTAYYYLRRTGVPHIHAHAQAVKIADDPSPHFPFTRNQYIAADRQHTARMKAQGLTPGGETPEVTAGQPGVPDWQERDNARWAMGRSTGL